MKTSKIKECRATKTGINNPTMSDACKNWNVVTGCDKYSDGCLNCYGEPMVEWLKRRGIDHYKRNGFKLTMCHYSAPIN